MVNKMQYYNGIITLSKLSVIVDIIMHKLNNNLMSTNLTLSVFSFWCFPSWTVFILEAFRARMI